MTRCIFCDIERGRVIKENSLAFVIADNFPVTEGHSLVIPKRHVEDWFGLTTEEMLDCNKLLAEVRRDLIGEDASISGFNIGANAGAAAGQTVFHCHIHLIPRRKGDVENPRGGVRHVIPGKGDYRS